MKKKQYDYFKWVYTIWKLKTKFIFKSFGIFIFLYGLLSGKIASPYFLSQLNFKVPHKQIRSHTPFFVPTCFTITIYLMNVSCWTPIRTLIIFILDLLFVFIIIFVLFFFFSLFHVVINYLVLVYFNNSYKL